ncbi:ABC transporter substrate-binding protein [Clostridium brassicae]|uniref:ABC transporter substrate-binding protein n=1 Tax=Clostridium brassicae TaxID=2999072 RepID=A0ABT4DBE1_9CLOT|nr:ABC transporter substrate-binding protein [Clostridium brassicae]MCY6958471.1 ABC transporter substrate-binding protein [Clostridium brassicae]
MSNKYFNIKDTLYDITEKYNEAIELLVSLGFSNLKDENMRKVFGKSISLEEALKLKKINVEIFVAELVDKIKKNEDKLSIKKDTVKISGVLPCPVRVPLTEAFEEWLADKNLNLDYELKAASMGIDWLKDTLINQSKEELPDIFISAGFDLFFDKKLFGKYKAENIFEDITDIEQYNDDFHNEYIKLEDPNKQYSIIGVVPAVFLVNEKELKGRQMPSSWEDILKKEFQNSVSLPVGDFDLFNAILLNIYKNYGEDGVKKLGRCLQRSMHPSEMVKSHIKKYDKPVVTIMPYFFTKMIKKGEPMIPVWPKDGAIISPIFMLSKNEKKKALKPIVDFFASKEVGEILSHNGKFPSVNPKVNNMITKENKYMWLGWDYIKEHDISSLIKKCENIFNSAVKGDERV